MQITSSATSIVAGHSARSAAGAAPNPAVAASNATDTIAPKGDSVQTVDFTHMTRQELFDWMNAEIKSGKMSFEESSPFLGMTLKVSADTGEPVDMRSDDTVNDFMAIARQGIDGAKRRNDDAFAKRLEAALALMQREQGTVSKLDVMV